MEVNQSSFLFLTIAIDITSPLEYLIRPEKLWLVRLLILTQAIAKETAAVLFHLIWVCHSLFMGLLGKK